MISILALSPCFLTVNWCCKMCYGWCYCFHRSDYIKVWVENDTRNRWFDLMVILITIWNQELYHGFLSLHSVKPLLHPIVHARTSCLTEKNWLICKGHLRYTCNFRTKYQGCTGPAMKIGMHIFSACTQDVSTNVSMPQG